MRTDRFLYRLALVLIGALAAFAGARLGSRRAPATLANAETQAGSEESDPGGAAGDDKNAEPPDEPEQPKGRSLAEWATLTASALFVALLVGAALYEQFAHDEPPGVQVAVELALDRAETRNGLTYIPFTVVNDGAAPAENVVVLFGIKRGDETVEESTADIAFLPNSGSVEGELVTVLDVAAYTVEARVATIQKP